jgi:outer membrane lipoprotein-sorting protein
MRWCVLLMMTIRATSFVAGQEPAAVDADLVKAASDEPALRAVLDQAEQMLARQKSVHVTADYRWEAGVEGKKESGRKKIEGWLVRPGRFRLTVIPEGSTVPDLVVVADGKTAYTYLPGHELFSAGPLVGPKAGLERNVIVSQALVGSGLEMTWRPDMARFIITQAQNILDRGFEKNRDVEGRHFSFSFGDVRVQLWFTEGDEPILKRVKRTTKLPTRDQDLPFELDIISDLTWDFTPPTDENIFRFSRPASARRVADLYAALAGDDPTQQTHSPETLSLADAQGKEALLPRGRATLFIVALAWDDATPKLLDLLEKARPASSSPPLSTGAVIIGDDPADLTPFAKEGRLLLLDREGALPTALSQDALPIVVYWDGTSVRASSAVSEQNLVDTVTKALNAPQK